MTLRRLTPARGIAPVAAAAESSPSPDALEERRFVRDREQARTVLAALAIPLAAFGVTDALFAAGDLHRLLVMWGGRAAVLLALGALWHQLGRMSKRPDFERTLFLAQLAGVAVSIATHFSRGADTLIVTRFEILCVVGYYVAIPLRARYQVVPAVTLSVVSLLLVVFWHTDVSRAELVSLVACFGLANILGMLLTRRRHATEAEEELAWRAMSMAHANLQKTVRELRALRGVVPICPGCRKVRGAREAWQQLEAFVAERGDVEFSPILCPTCLAAEFGAVIPPSPGP